MWPGCDYGYAQSISPLVPEEQQISTGLNVRVGGRISLEIYGNDGRQTRNPTWAAAFPSC